MEVMPENCTIPVALPGITWLRRSTAEAQTTPLAETRVLAHLEGMPMLRVCLYGGWRRDGTPMDFVSALAEKIVSTLPAVIVTGGYVDHDQGTTESAALVGARRAAEALSTDLSGVFEAWLPDVRSDDRGTRRMSRDLGITVRELPGRTALGRRLSMVAGVDVVVTFTGGRAVVTRAGLPFGESSR
jgi:hypothetical protein